MCNSPFDIPTAFLIRIPVGGVLSTNVKLLSSKTVMTAGMISPLCCAVLALYSLQNAIIFTPFAPSAGPTGGEGFAFPASQTTFITAATRNDERVKQGALILVFQCH